MKRDYSRFSLQLRLVLMGSGMGNMVMMKRRWCRRMEEEEGVVVILGGKMRRFFFFDEVEGERDEKIKLY